VHSPSGSRELTGLLAQNTYWLRPPLIPIGSLESQRQTLGVWSVWREAGVEIGWGGLRAPGFGAEASGRRAVAPGSCTADRIPARNGLPPTRFGSSAIRSNAFTGLHFARHRITGDNFWRRILAHFFRALGAKKVEAPGIEPGSAQESLQPLRAYPIIKSRPTDCQSAGHPPRQRPRESLAPSPGHPALEPACYLRPTRPAGVSGQTSRN